MKKKNLNGVKSDDVPVPQGSHTVPSILSDPPEQVKANVRLFADDTALYLTFSKSATPAILQQDLQHLESWEKAWDMQFDSSKCQVIHIMRSRRSVKTSTTCTWIS